MSTTGHYDTLQDVFDQHQRKLYDRGSQGVNGERNKGRNFGHQEQSSENGHGNEGIFADIMNFGLSSGNELSVLKTLNLILLTIVVLFYE